MTTKISLSTMLVFVLASCQGPRVQSHPQQETPKALEDKSSFEIISKRGRENLVEKLYSELVSKDDQLKRLEEKIDALNGSKNDSTELFDNFNDKITSYFSSADGHVSQIQDSLLRDKMKLLIASNLEKYNARIAKHDALLKAIASNETSISDLHTILKLVRTLPVIEKYQRDNPPSTKPLEGFIKQQHQTINLADTLVKQ